MPNIRKKRLPHKELLRKLKEHGVIVVPHRGKGSEAMLGLKSGLDASGKYTGAHITIGTHSSHGKKEHSPSVTDTILETFGIKEEDFWKE